jgi:hypothetical protein
MREVAASQHNCLKRLNKMLFTIGVVLQACKKCKNKVLNNNNTVMSSLKRYQQS